MITNLEDSIFLNKNCRLISVRHEQAWAFAAEGYTRTSWMTWVALATSGPGATNLVTGIASAYFDSIPVLYITGQVRSDELTPAHSRVRQTGFQETKIVPIVQPITKYAVHIGDVKNLRFELEKAFWIMHTWRKWPVLLDISMDVQREQIEPADLLSFYDSEEYWDEQNYSWWTIQDKIHIVLKELMLSKRPIILVGWWIRLSWASQELKEFITSSNIPVVASLMGIDVVPSENPLYIWMIWSYGVRYANLALSHADLVIVLWSRLDLRQTWAMKDKFIQNGKIIHIDIDNEELGYNVKHTQYKIHANLAEFLTHLNAIDFTYPDFSDWNNKLQKLKQLLPVYPSKVLYDNIHPNYFFEKFSSISQWDVIYVNDVWQNQMWASQSLRLKEWERILNSGGLGSMGFSLPAALGSACYMKELWRVVSINGDGWFQMNIQELETISLRKLPVGIIVLNNSSLGMVREFQDTYFDGRNIWTVIGYSCPNIELIANAYKIPYFLISHLDDVDPVLAQIQQMNTPYILEVKISQKAIVEPKMLYGNTLDKQSPPLSQEIETEIQNILS